MMRKSTNRFFSLLLALAMVFSMVPVTGFAADTACSDHTFDAFNGSPACVDADGKLHLCASNFPDANFLAYVTQYGGDGNIDSITDGYLTVDEAGCVRTIACENRNIASLDGIQFFTDLLELYCSDNPLTELDISKNVNLGYLSCAYCDLEQLDVSMLPNLSGLMVYENELTQLDLRSNVNLRSLHCYNNRLTALDVSMLPDLEMLDCSGNELTSLDMTSNIKLQHLICNNNQLTSLQIHTCSDLGILDCGGNQLTALSVLNQPKLQYLRCWDNPLTSLDVAVNTALLELNVSQNQLTQLDISSNTALETLYADNNRLTELDVSQNTKLVSLDASYNQLTQLDISSCANLTHLNLDTNALSQIDLHSNTKLTNLNLRNNALTEVDISTLQELNVAQFCMNALTELDVSNNTKLQQLSFSDNKIGAIDLSNNPDIFRLVCNNNRLTELDVSTQTKLEHLNCIFNQLAALDLNANVNLNDVSIDSQFVHTTVPYTKTENGYEVDLRDLVGDKWNMIYSVSGCISFDSTAGIATFENEPFALDYWYTTSTDRTMYVSYGDVPYHDPVTFPAHAVLENGELKLTAENFPDANFLTFIQSSDWDNDQNGCLSAAEAGRVHWIDCINTGITSLKGIEFFSNLRDLRCQSNHLTELDVSSNAQLNSLNCAENPITKLTLGNLPILRELYVGNAQLTELDTSGCPELRYLSCYTNKLTSIDLSNLSKLTQLYVYENQLTELDISTNTQLRELNCSYNQLTELDVSTNTQLRELNCGYNRLTTLDLSNNTNLADLSCVENQLLTLDASNTALTNFNGSSQSIPGVIISTYKDGYYEVDIAAIVGENNIQNIQIVDNCFSYDSSTGIAIFGEEPFNLTYHYQINSNYTMCVQYGQVDPSGPVTFPAGATLVNGELALIDDNFPDEKFLSVIMAYDYDGSGGLSAAEAGQITSLYLDCLNVSDLTGIGYFTNLVELNCNTNQLTSLDLSGNVNLVTLYCSENNLKTLDLSKNTKLRNLYCSSSGLTALDVSNNTQLRRLHCSYNELTALDVTALSKLAQLDVSQNNLTALDVSQNALLRELNAGENKLTVLDVSNNTELTHLNCYRNRFVSLDLSANTRLIDAQIHDQSVSATLNAIRDGDQYTLNMSAVVGADNLSKITFIENAGYDAATGIAHFGFEPIVVNYQIEPAPGFLMNVAYGEVACTDPVVFPAGAALVNGELALNDDNFPNEDFRNYIRSNYDSDKNEYLSAAEAGRITELNIEANGITDLTGIEYFTNLYRLNCSNNPITTLDLSKNTQLRELSFNDSSVSSADLTGLTKLRYLSCGNTQLTALDISHCTELRTLYCFATQLTALDVHGLSKLTELRAENNQLTQLDVSGCTELRQLHCYSNQLTSLNIADLAHLEALDIRENAFPCLDVTANTSLQQLNCSGNPLLYLNAPDGMWYLECGDIRVEAVVSSVYTDNGYAVDMSAIVGKDNLARISYVDRAYQYDPVTGIAFFYEEPFSVWYHYQANVQYQIGVNYGDLPPSGPAAPFQSKYVNENGELEISENTFPDTAFRQLITENGWDWDQNGYLSVYEAGNITDLHCSGRSIASLKGIEHFTNLYKLNCSYNQIAELDLSKNIHLTELECEYNQLSSLNVSANTKLRVLDCSNNQLSALDVTGNTQLRKLELDTNALSQIDLSKNTKLTDLNLRNNDLTQVDVSTLTELRDAQFCTNELTELDVSKNTKLEELSFSENRLSRIDLSNNPNLTWLVCYMNQLTELDVSHLTDLQYLDVRENQLLYLDLSKNANLQGGDFGVQNVEAKVTSVASGDFYTVDMSQFVGSLYGNIRNVEEAEYDPATGIATFDHQPGHVIYIIDPCIANWPGAELRVYAGCIHDWIAPTCTAPKTCSKCQATEGDPCHQWKAATCSAPKTCILCNATEGDPTGTHKYGIWIVDNAPTATDEGSRQRTCNGCDDTQVQAIEKLTVTEENRNGGRIENITSPGENAYAGQINHDAEELIEKLLTDEEKQAVNDGALVSITLTVDDILDTISYQDMTMIEEVCDSISGVFGPNPLKMGMALDINLYKQVGTNEPEKITQTNASDSGEYNEPVMVSLDLPEELRLTDLFGYREYLVIRIHDGEPEILMSMYNEKTHQLTFETNAFSTYSVIYADITQGPIVDWNLTLGGNIGVNFYSYMEEDVAQRVQVRITVAGKTSLIDAVNAPLDGRGLYTFGVKLAAAQMTDIIQLEILVDGEVYSTDEYSIREYALRMLDMGYDDYTIELLINMLNYGAMAQLYFDYNTDQLANEGVEIEGFADILQPEYPMGVTGALPGIRYHGATLVFDSNTAVRFYFEVTGNIDDYDFAVEGVEPVEKDGLYYIEIADINPQDLDTLIELTVTMGEDSFSVSYSPMHYIYRMYSRSTNDDLRVLLQAMFGYYQAAEAYVQYNTAA